MAEVGRAQTVDVRPRRVATEGPPVSGKPPQPVWESMPAAAGNHALAVFNVSPVQSSDPKLTIGWASARYDAGQQTWEYVSEGLISFPPPGPLHPNGLNRSADPWVHWDALAGRYVITGIVEHYETNLKALGVSFMDPVMQRGPSAWRMVEVGPGQILAPLDKPAFTLGEVINGKRELYVTGHRISTSQLLWARSMDGGDTWTGGLETSVTQVGFTSPTALGGSPLFVSYLGEAVQSVRRHRFIQGTDSGSGVSFATMMTNASDPLVVQPRADGIADFIPFPAAAGAGWSIFPNLAVDPLDPNNVLHFVYHDVVDPLATGEKDVNVYYRKLTRNAGTGFWTAGPEILVNDDNALTVTDQFLPCIVVGPDGTVHVAFYDDRDYEQLDKGHPMYDASLVRCNVYYAFKRPEDPSFTINQNWKLYLTDPSPTDPPAMNFAHSVPIGTYYPGEYFGISIKDDNATDPVYEIWISYPGSADDPACGPPNPCDDTLIWTTRVLFSPN